MDYDNTSLSDFERGYKKAVLDITADAYSNAFADLSSERPLEIKYISKNVSPLQCGKETYVLFHYLLKGYGVPLQIREFIYKILTVSREVNPDNSFFLSDTALEKYFGCSRNYCCAVRKRLKLWQNEMLSTGLHNTRLVSIEDSSYNPRTKEAIKTKYTLNFLDLLVRLLKEVQQNKHYKKNFLLAIQEVCDLNRERILEFGAYSQRKERQPRTWEKVEATLLKTFENLTNKILEMRRRNGVEPEQTEKDLTAIVKTARSEMILGVVAGRQTNVRSIDRQQNPSESSAKETRNGFDKNDLRGVESRGKSKFEADLDRQKLKFMEKPKE